MDLMEHLHCMALLVGLIEPRHNEICICAFVI
jgi:hypothetical protein